MRRIGFADGPSIIAKPRATVRAEARMLRATRAAGVPAPEVLAAEANLLLPEGLGPDVGLLAAADQA